MTYAHIALNQTISQPYFVYKIPDGLHLEPGHLVRVSFRTAQEAGIVVGLSDEEPGFATKPILERLDPRPVLNPVQLALAHWMAETTLSPLGPCLWLMLPPGFTPRSDYIYSLLAPDVAVKDELEAHLLELLTKRGALTGRQITQAIGGTEWRKAAQVLVKTGILNAEASLAPPTVKAKVVRTVQLAIPPEEIVRTWRSPIYDDLLNCLIDAGGALDAQALYTQSGAKLTHLNKLQDAGIVLLGESEIWRDSLANRNTIPSTPHRLTAAQSSAWEAIHASLEGNGGAFLLHGVTGSGKTELYLRAVERTLAHGRGAIILVPEIALTTQMVARFMSRFPGQVALIHSTLSTGERYDTWRRARDGQISVMIGARSALFAPLPDVGLVVLDEEHDDSYKQSPPIGQPYYHARDAALEMMRLNHGTLLLGSATPDVITVHRSEAGAFPLLSLPERVATEGTPTLPPVQIVDMRQELRAGHTAIFSRPLMSALAQTLAKNQQAILFLNRRGTASYVFCRDCGYIAKCPHCDTPLTYHRNNEILTCHHCGHHTPNLQRCPECGSRRIKYFNGGTELIEKMLAAEFPEARIQRWDRDTASHHEDHERIYHAFASGEANVLVGTQMITKGLDLPNVTLVGIVAADVGLGLPDYRTCENTFQLLTQVAGRAGRGMHGGQVILQTYQPDHYAIQAAALHDYEGFYAKEIGYRRELLWPPFTRLARILFRHTAEPKVAEEAKRIAKMLRDHIESEDHTATNLIGPVPCFYTRLDKFYRWHILVRGPNPAALLHGLDLGDLATLDIDPVDIL
jgi:primosomal protein N' (replication factor Y) (superfamily II helicase)